MEEVNYQGKPVLVIGNKELTYSAAVCLLQAGHPVTLCTDDRNAARESMQAHFYDLSKRMCNVPPRRDLEIVEMLDRKIPHELIIAITGEDLPVKEKLIRQLEENASIQAVIGINMESIPLSALQKYCRYPERLIGINWVEPAHTTYFLEMITNEDTTDELADRLFKLAKACWGKDPYKIKKDTGIRARMFAAMAREAFYLVENGYASFEDIDRACRNDAGYYLPFAGNFRYMDLMGTYSYGVVMKDLNPELSKQVELPGFFNEMISQGRLGMSAGSGFYNYEDRQVKKWNRLFRQFSYQILELMLKYPFNYKIKNKTEQL